MFFWIANHPESTILFLLSFFCLWQAWWFKKDFFSPATIYCFTQSLTLGIAYLQLHPAMTAFHPKTWMFWIGALVSFSAGSFLVHFITKSKGSPVLISPPSPPSGYNWKLHILLSFIPFFIFLIGIYGLVQKTGSLLVFADDPARWMTKDIDYSYYAAMFSSGPLLVLLFGVASFKKYNVHFYTRVVARVMVVASIVLNLLAYPNRGALFFNLGALVILSNYLRKRISAIWVLSLLSLAIIAFLGISIIRNQYGFNSVERMALNTAVELPYKYLANNYWNLDYAINPPPEKEYHPHTYGIDFFYGVFDYLRIGGSFRSSYHWDGLFNESVEKVSGLNTASYLWEVYKDLYAPGIFLFPFFCAIALTFLHLKMCRPFKPRTVLFYTFFIYFIGWWWFTPGYKQGIYWVWMVFLFVIPTLSMQKSLPAEAPLIGKAADE